VVLSKPITLAQAPKQACYHAWEAWGPHPGCKEFMTQPEAIIQCAEPAQYVAKCTSPWGEERYLVCTQHAREIRQTKDGLRCRVYRYRYVK